MKQYGIDMIPKSVQLFINSPRQRAPSRSPKAKLLIENGFRQNIEQQIENIQKVQRDKRKLLPSLKVHNLNKVRNERSECQDAQRRKQEKNKNMLMDKMKELVASPHQTISLRYCEPSIGFRAILKKQGNSHQYNIPLMSKDDLLFKKDEINTIQSQSQIQAFSKKSFSIVRVIRNQTFHFPFSSEQQLGTVKIFGRIKIKFFDFVVAAPTEGVTLQQIIKQFGIIKERTIISYLKGITKGLKSIHTKSFFFNNLSLDRIIIKYNGQSCIDTLKAKPANLISNEDKRNQFYYLSPQVLLLNKNSQKNDVWSLGSIALSMLLGSKLSQNHDHPYNSSSTSQNSEPTLTKVQNFRTKLFKQTKGNSSMSLINQSSEKIQQGLISPFKKSTEIKNLQNKSTKQSEAIDIEVSERFFTFIQNCLIIEQQERPTLDELFDKYEFLQF